MGPNVVTSSLTLDNISGRPHMDLLVVQAGRVWKYRRWLVLAVLIATLLSLQGEPTALTVTEAQEASSIPGHFANLPLAFESNGGQTDPTVSFIAHNRAQTILIKTSGLALRMQDHQPTTARAKSVTEVGLEFVDASLDVQLQGGEALPGTVNYIAGNDPTHWHTGLPTFRNVTYSMLYPGVDLGYQGTSGELEGTYTIAPGADPDMIRWRYTSLNEQQKPLIQIDPWGNLVIKISSAMEDTLRVHAPVAWQEDEGAQIPVTTEYVVYDDRSIGFKIGTHDAHRPLILQVRGFGGRVPGASDTLQSTPRAIGPTLGYSTYLGGGQGDQGIAVAVDSNGNTYISGFTSSTDFPLTNPLQPSFGGGSDAFVTKINSAGTALVYSTYLGGSNEDESWGIAVDSSGSAYVSGWTNSTDFPTANAFQSAKGGGRDAFVAKLNPAGTALVYSTYLGGSQDDRSWDLAESGGYAYVTGETQSTNFPVMYPIQSSNHGGKDIFVTKFSLSGMTLIYSTYLGGSAEDVALGATANAAGDAYITGGSYSNNYPTRMAYQPTNRGGEDAVVSKINPDGTALIYSTYLGGARDDISWDVAISQQGDAYLGGDTSSTDFPIRRAVQSTKGFGEDGFVSRLAPTGAWIVYSTYLGGNGQFDAPYGIAVDLQGHAFVTSLVSATDFPVVNPIQANYGGNSDTAVSMFSPLGAPLLFSTYLGGANEDFGWRTAVDGNGNVYATGLTRSSDFPTAMPIQPNLTGNSDAFVVKITGLPGPTPTPVLCTVQFSDVPTDSTFYPFVHCIACERIATGYDDGTFRPNNPISRGQLAKIASNAGGFNDPITSQRFEDVLPGSLFHDYIERLALHGVVSGYPCGGVGEPCVLPLNRPYFRWGANVTRGQAAKIVAGIAAFPDPAPGTQRFEDVPTTNPFNRPIEMLASRNLVSGYPCGGEGEPCGSGNKPYFRPANNVTRGQVAKIVANTFLAECVQGQANADR